MIQSRWDCVRARQVANQIALCDAIEKYGVKKVFTFHRDVKSAQSFVSDGPEGVGTHLADVAADVRRLEKNFQFPISNLGLVTLTATRPPGKSSGSRIPRGLRSTWNRERRERLPGNCGNFLDGQLCQAHI
jgi:hypothetical protein